MAMRKSMSMTLARFGWTMTTIIGMSTNMGTAFRCGPVHVTPCRSSSAVIPTMQPNRSMTPWTPTPPGAERC
jgi:hypothetical protein